MKIDFRQTLKKLDGTDMPDLSVKVTPGEDGEEKKSPPLTLGGLVADLLLSGAEKIDGKEKVRRYRLANKVFGAKEPIALKAEDISLIKELAGKYAYPLACGQIWAMVDPEEAPTVAAAE